MSAPRTFSIKLGAFYTTDEGVNVEPAITLRVSEPVDWTALIERTMAVLADQVSGLANARVDGELIMPGIRPMTPEEVRDHVEQQEQDEDE